MDDDQKKQLEHIRDDLVKLSSDMAADEDRPPEERISLLMAKIRTNPDFETVHAAHKAIEELENKNAKLDAALDLIEEIEVMLGNITSSDDNGDNNQEEKKEDGSDHLVESPHPGDGDHPEHNEHEGEHHEHHG